MLGTKSSEEGRNGHIYLAPEGVLTDSGIRQTPSLAPTGAPRWLASDWTVAVDRATRASMAQRSKMERRAL